MAQSTSILQQDLSRGGLQPLAVAKLMSSYGPKIPAIVRSLKVAYEDGNLPFLNLPEQVRDMAAFTSVAEHFRPFEHVIILGTGGSSLGGKTLCALSDRSAKAPTLHFLDNIDPATFDGLRSRVNLERTGFLVISKSGGTAETLAQFLSLIPMLSAGWEQRVVVITEEGDSPLRKIAEHFRLPCLAHDSALGGRFSALSVTGLLPALIAGVDILQVREGARWVVSDFFSKATPAPAEGALWNIAWAGAGKSQAVLMPYADALSDFALWYRQLWAESLGKDGRGTTPIRAMGTVDQHSQLQLYLDGPSDKLFTLILKDAGGLGPRMAPELTAIDPRLSYLSGRTLGDLLVAEQQATLETLSRKHCPVRVLRVADVTPLTLGALLMHFMLETVVAAELLGVNAYDQPAVEEGKILARQYMQPEAQTLARVVL